MEQWDAPIPTIGTSRKYVKLFTLSIGMPYHQRFWFTSEWNAVEFDYCARNDVDTDMCAFDVGKFETWQRN